MLTRKINPPGGGTTTFELFNAKVSFTNSSPATSQISLDGITTNSFGNNLAFYNSLATLSNTNALDDGPLTLGDTIFTINNDLTLFPSTVLNFTLDTNANQMAVAGNLRLGGTVNVTGGNGFAGGTYTLLTYAGNLDGNIPSLGSTPAGFTYAFDTNTFGQVNLIVTPPTPGVPATLVASPTNLAINLSWSPSINATSYNLKRGTASGVYPTIFSGLTATNYTDANVTNGVTYFYVVSAINSFGESANSLQVSATPLPSTTPANIGFQTVGNQ